MNMIDQILSVGNSENEVVVDIVMCVMWRVDFLPWTVACLESQEEKRFQLAIWNNNVEQRRVVEEKIIECRPSFPVNIFHSGHNCAGMGRFYLIKSNNINMDRPLIMIDDDQVLCPNFVAALTQRFGTDRVVGDWAWRFKPGGSYWDRVRCQEGEEAHYIGTGGLILDPKLVASSDFPQGLPERFSRIEDLWFSFYATTALGCKLIAAPQLVRQVRDGRDQFPSLRQTKNEFLDWLRKEKNWRV